jgi:hypothetical protein
MYQIQPYTHIQAKSLGVDVYPSTRKNKKIDVYKTGKYICSIGALGMNDYPTYIKSKGIQYANERRRLYHLRHKKDNVIGTAGWYSLNLLW